MWSENEETDTRSRKRELRETGGGDSVNYDHSLGQMLHEQPEDLSISLWELVDQAVDGLVARLGTVSLCSERVVHKRLQGVPNTPHTKYIYTPSSFDLF